ncbi:hypothetical protein CAL7102_07385 [Dulcicalothrix desertica PCC 7102]|nr:hypothetical protein CAL7102_07385 [Dulcicalothrix desertica PCC 7102]
MSRTLPSKPQPYHVFLGGISVYKESHDEEGDWYPPIVLPYFWRIQFTLGEPFPAGIRL